MFCFCFFHFYRFYKFFSLMARSLIWVDDVKDRDVQYFSQIYITAEGNIIWTRLSLRLEMKLVHPDFACF